MKAHRRWKKLSAEQLSGAEYALRVLRSWPRVNGQVLAEVDEMIGQLHSEFHKRQAFGVVPR